MRKYISTFNHFLTLKVCIIVADILPHGHQGHLFHSQYHGNARSQGISSLWSLPILCQTGHQKLMELLLKLIKSYSAGLLFENVKINMILIWVWPLWFNLNILICHISFEIQMVSCTPDAIILLVLCRLGVILEGHPLIDYNLFALTAWTKIGSWFWEKFTGVFKDSSMIVIE